MADTHWASDENRLLMPTPTMDRDTRDYTRRMSMADNQRIRAYRAGQALRAWEAGDPGRGGKPWRPFCRDLWEMGVQDRAHQVIALCERDLARKLEKRQARERKARERYERELRQRRVDRAWKIARLVLGRKRTRKLRRWRKRWTR